MLLEDILTEGLSQVLFHKTNVRNALEMLKTDSIRPSGVVKDTEVAFKTSARQLYYVSFARSKRSAYFVDSDGRANIGDVILTFDGRALQNRYSGGPVDYWQNSVFGDEMEDRLYTTDTDIEDAIDYIIRIDFYHPEPRPEGDSDVLRRMDEENKERNFRIIRELIKEGKQANIEIRGHRTTDSLLSPSPRDLVDLRNFFETRPEPESRRDLSALKPDDQFIDVIKQLLFEPHFERLSKRARSTAFDLRRGRVTHDFIQQMKVALHNEAANPRELDPILQYMRRNNIRTVEELAEDILDMWED